MNLTALTAVAGIPRSEWSPGPLRYNDIRPGSYQAAARIVDMNADHILMSMCFPSVTRFCGQIFWEGKDHELGLTCVKAYNDWMIEEWCGTVPGRLVPLIIVPLWDPAEAAKEIERCASLGAKGISFCENPSRLGLPSLHSEDHFWDPLFAAAQDTGIPLCLHIGSSSSTYSTAPDAPLIASFTLTPVNAYATLVDWMYSGHFLRFPKLKVCLSESGVNWIPIFLEKIARDLDRQEWARDARSRATRSATSLPTPPFGGVGEIRPTRVVQIQHARAS